MSAAREVMARAMVVRDHKLIAGCSAEPLEEEYVLNLLAAGFDALSSAGYVVLDPEEAEAMLKADSLFGGDLELTDEEARHCQAGWDRLNAAARVRGGVEHAGGS